MGKTEKEKPNLFKAAVDKSPEIKGCWCPGLSAMGKNSSAVSVGDTNFLQGSVDIDTSTLLGHPDESRWDYTIGYNDEAYFIEVHPADTKNVDEMVKKLTG